jgi:4-diphosphocytidyl-2-C-methyl-D-erythritol kinase
VDRITEAIGRAVGAAGDGAELARAKVNLALHVTGRRTDGYHLIESLVVFAEHADVVGVAQSGSRRMGLSVKGPFADALAEVTEPQDNLVIRAADDLAREMASHRPRPAKLVLTKRIPVAAGLGGGSADAAATLRLLGREWHFRGKDAGLAEIGLRLGADVPMCLASTPLIARGIGERIEPVAGVPPVPIVLARPPVVVRTPAVFARLGGGERPPLPRLPQRFGSILDLVFWLRQTRNDLEEPAGEVEKAARAAVSLLRADPDCMFARMSGSGAAAFGIFVSLAAAERAAERLAAARPTWWVTATMTGGSPAAADAGTR